MPELTRFIVIGGVCFMLDVVLVFVLRFQVWFGPTTSKTLSSLVATVVGYLGNQLWSFSHRVDDGRRTQDVLVYAGINVVGLTITLIPVDVAHYLLKDTSPTAFSVRGGRLGGEAVAQQRGQCDQRAAHSGDGAQWLTDQVGDLRLGGHAPTHASPQTHDATTTKLRLGLDGPLGRGCGRREHLS